jgi:hypothetical protein
MEGYLNTSNVLSRCMQFRSDYDFNLNLNIIIDPIISEAKAPRLEIKVMTMPIEPS